jgi:outer membrane protein TolC
MLGNFINQTLSENTILEKPAVVALPSEVTINRPELSLYNYQTEQIAAQYAVGNVSNLPKLSLFVQGGYGRPGLNMLLNEFDAYYVGGIRMSWTLGGLYNQHRDKSLRDNKLQMIGVQRETFLFNTNLSLQQAEQEILKLKQLIEVDNELIALRASIKNTSRKQLDNGVITEHDYLLDLNAEDQARQNQLLHEVQLMMAYYNYKTLSGY